jgi:hypothetical protein
MTTTRTVRPAALIAAVAPKAHTSHSGKQSIRASSTKCAVLRTEVLVRSYLAGVIAAHRRVARNGIAAERFPDDGVAKFSAPQKAEATLRSARP